MRGVGGVAAGAVKERVVVVCGAGEQVALNARLNHQVVQQVAVVNACQAAMRVEVRQRGGTFRMSPRNVALGSGRRYRGNRCVRSAAGRG